jgi:hypothetical protein
VCEGNREGVVCEGLSLLPSTNKLKGEKGANYFHPQALTLQLQLQYSHSFSLHDPIERVIPMAMLIIVLRNLYMDREREGKKGIIYRTKKGGKGPSR